MSLIELIAFTIKDHLWMVWRYYHQQPWVNENCNHHQRFWTPGPLWPCRTPPAQMKFGFSWTTTRTGPERLGSTASAAVKALLRLAAYWDSQILMLTIHSHWSPEIPQRYAQIHLGWLRDSWKWLIFGLESDLQRVCVTTMVHRNELAGVSLPTSKTCQPEHRCNQRVVWNCEQLQAPTIFWMLAMFMGRTFNVECRKPLEVLRLLCMFSFTPFQESNRAMEIDTFHGATHLTLEFPAMAILSQGGDSGSKPLSSPSTFIVRRCFVSRKSVCFAPFFHGKSWKLADLGWTFFLQPFYFEVFKSFRSCFFLAKEPEKSILV